MRIIRNGKLAFLLPAMLLLLCACGGEEATRTYTVERYGRTYTVDQEARTVTYQGVTYSFAISSGTVTFTAPDGSTAYWHETEQVGSGGWSDGWDESVHPGDLSDALTHGPGHSRDRSGSPLAGLVLIAVGAFNTLAPSTAWYLSYGWKFKDAEPSEAALGLGRAGGVISILLGLVLCFV